MHIRTLGRVDYMPTWQAMREFTAQRTRDTSDEIWLLEHPPVYTLGLSGKRKHLLQETVIPVIYVDRGGQITYHGPGQLVVYLLLDLRRQNYGVRGLVRRVESAVIEFLATYRINAHGELNAPGVYVQGAKIAALGFKVRNGCTYHGLALNIDMELAPFKAINPCGYPDLEVTQLKDLGVTEKVADVAIKLPHYLSSALSK